MKNFTMIGTFALIFLTNVVRAKTPQSPVSKSQRTVSKFGTAIKMSRAKFKIAIQFRLDQGAKFNRVKNKVSNSSLLKKYIPWVQSATYSSVQSNGSYQFNLAIGKYGFIYNQSFICRKSESQKDWTEECIEQSAGSKSAVMTGAALKTQCATLSNGGVQCDFYLQGQMHDVHAFFVTLSAAKVAYNFYLQYTSYAAQIGTFKGSNFQKMMKDLKFQEKAAIRQSSIGTYNFITQILSSSRA